jgi:Glycosyl hydrolase family 26
VRAGTPRTKRGWAALTLCVVLPIAAAAALATAISTVTPAAAGHPKPPPAAEARLPRVKHWLGVREPGQPSSWDGYEAFVTATGTHPQIVLYYSAWFEPFQTRFAQQARARGATVLVQMQPWGGGNLARIASGAFDRYLRSFAASVRDFGHPVIIGFGHEMNGPWYPWGSTHDRAATFVAAWRHVVTVFRRQGADNVTWLWTISRGGLGTKRKISLYWPGASYVTWVGIDGYYYVRTDTFAKVYGKTIALVRKFTDAPILLAEAAIGQVAGQARDIPGLFHGIERDHLLGVVWYDVAQKGSLWHQDWRLEGHPAALAAFRRAAAAMERRPARAQAR